MDLASAARKINDTGYGYIASWALLTACEQRLFDRLPAAAEELADTYPDPSLVDTWLQVLAEEGLVEQVDGVWHLNDSMARLLVGDDSYADYLGGQVLQQMTPRLTLGAGDNVLADVLTDPDQRAGYEGWFADADEAATYQASQYAGSLGPARSIAKSLPDTDDRVLDLGGGWGAIARSIVKHHDVEVDVVDLDVVVDTAPPVDERVSFVAGSALDPATWPTDTDDVSYDGAVLSYLFSSVPGDTHDSLLDALTERDMSWIAIHDFMLGGGAHAAAWSLQHAVFVPNHRSRSIDELSTMLSTRGFEVDAATPIVDDMTTLVVGHRA
jgi:hypothetical protein